MNHCKLGKNGPLVSEQGLGCMGMSEFYGLRNDEQSLKVIARAIELGITFFDTADMYGSGDNELLVGKGLKSHRKTVVLATKFGNVRGPQGEFLGINGKPDYVQQACEASLRRLGTDYIDLYQQHRVDLNVPIEETVGAMARLVEQGKVRYLGLSEASADTIRRAAKVHTMTSLQSEYSLWERHVEQEILPTCRELGIGFIAYSPLGRGFLAGRFKGDQTFEPGDNRVNFPRFQEGNIEANVKWLAAIEALAAEKTCKPAQLALAWVLVQGSDIVPIPGTKRLKYLEENVGAQQVTLTPADLQRLDEMAPASEIKGTRYPERGMKTVGR